jgi:21S rRNA (GM2251-2'-O)-methyltransferase
LECSEFPVDKLTSLGFYHPETFQTELHASSKESFYITSSKDQHRPPLWVALDRIMDPMNLGALLRSCYFFQVDGIILSLRDSCPLSAVVSKASAGALESTQHIYSTYNLSKFLKSSSDKGWYIYGTDLNHPEKQNVIPLNESKHHLDFPTVLVLGNEGDGMDASVSKQCDQHLIIGPKRHEGDVVDSLNVSVSGGILLNHLC